MAFDKLRGFFAPRPKAPRTSSGEPQWITQLLKHNRPPTLGSEELINYYKQSPRLHMAVSRIADAFANVEWRVGYLKPKGRSPKQALRAKSVTPTTIQKLRQKAEEQELEFVEIDQHLMLELLYGGNAILPGLDVRRLGQIYLELLGESYALTQRNGAGKPVALWPFPATWIRKRPTVDYPYYDIKLGAKTHTIDPHEVFAVRNPDPANPMVGGVGAGQALGTELDTDEYAAEFTKAHFYNHGTPSRILAFEKISDTEAKRLGATYRQKYQGVKKAGQVEIVGGMKPVDIKLSDSITESGVDVVRTNARDVITQTFGLPPEVLGIIESSNRATIEGADVIMARYVVRPRAEKWLGYLQRLALEYDPRLIVTYDDPTPDDRDRQLEYAKAAPWALTRGEWRERAGAEDRGDVDEIHIEQISNVARRPEGDQVLAPFDVPIMGGDSLDVGAYGTAPDDTTPKDAQTILGYHLQYGIATINEARENLNLDPVPWGDVTVPELLRNLGSGGVEQLGVRQELKSMATAIRALGKARAAQGVAPTQKDDDRINRVIESLRPERLQRELSPQARKAISEIGNAELVELGLSINFNMLNPEVVRFLEKFGGDRITKINTTTRDAVKAELIEGVRAGEGVDKLRRRINGVMTDATTWRARTIARTESVMAQSFASRTAWVQSGLVSQKQWLSVIDGDTRDTHIDLQGQVVGVAEEFTSSDGDTGQGPGDFGLARNNINCRCAHIAVVDEPKAASELGTIWKVSEARRMEIEEAYFVSARHGFNAQERDVLIALLKYFG